MQLAIVHDTVYRYAGAASSIIQALRLWPTLGEGQQVVGEWQVDVDGKRLQPACLDGFGNYVATHTLEAKADSMHVKVRGQVDTLNLKGVHRGKEAFPPMFFVSCTDRTAPFPEMAALAAAAGSGSEFERLQRLVNAVRDRMECSPDRCCTENSAAEAFLLGAGGCGDLTHVLIAAARALDFPARYVSGYMQAGAAGATSSHAWGEVFVKDLGWVGLDTANRRVCDDRYVRIASGRDYRDAASVRGVQLGGVAEAMEVTRSSSPRSSMQSPGSSQTQGSSQSQSQRNS